MNGPQLRQHPDGTTSFGSPDKEPPVLYMEAELNSPMVRLEPGESYNFDTEWFPTPADKDFQSVTDAGVILKPLRAVQDAGAGKIRLVGGVGVFFSGGLVVHFFEAPGLVPG